MMPRRFAIATFSPRLDTNGNRVRGIRFTEDLAARWDLHLFHRDQTLGATDFVRSHALAGV